MKDVDRMLLREYLKLTVQQRLEKFQRFMKLAVELRGAARKPSAMGETCSLNLGDVLFATA
jgi:hypothetical protein